MVLSRWRSKVALDKNFKEGWAHTAFFATFHNTACWLTGDDDVVDGQDGEDDDLSDGCGNDLREGKGEAMGLEVRELAMVELLDREEVGPSSLPSRFLLLREFSLSTAATS